MDIHNSPAYPSSLPSSSSSSLPSPRSANFEMCRKLFVYWLLALAIALYRHDVAQGGPIETAINWAQADRISIDVSLPWLPYENETRCFGEIGCLNITRDWYHLIHRPFNVFPLARSVINTRFILYTKKNPSDGQTISADDPHSIESSDFCTKCSTKFIIHGFIDTPLSNWISEMKDELLKAGDLNVIVVDWAGGSLPLYTQATANTRVVGLEVAYLVAKLGEHGLKPEDVHIIGHSLGAHTAGYAGERIPGLGRITGLDPAEPYFQGMGPSIRLDPGDARFVDVIHTDGRNFFLLEIPGYGMSQSCGHIDFYPNNGKEQPGCALSQEGGALVPLTLIKDGIEEASRVLLACNHVRAIKLFIDSINGKCQYVAHRCPSYQQFLSGRCFKCNNQNCALMGYHAVMPPAVQNNSAYIVSENEIQPDTDDTAAAAATSANNGGQQQQQTNNSINVVPSSSATTQTGKYFLATGRDFPYCQRHYRFTLELAKPAIAEHWVRGYLKVNIFSDRGVLRNIDLTPKLPARMEHGSSYQIVITNPHDLGERFRKIEMNWAHEMNVLEPRSLCLLWCNDHLYVKSIQVETLHMPIRERRSGQYTNKLCAAKSQYADIENRGMSTFYSSCKR